MTSLPKVLGLTATGLSLWLSGAIGSISLLTIPTLSSSSLPNQQALQIWQVIFNNGKKYAPAVAAVAALLHVGSSYLRVQSWRQLSTSRLVAAGLTIAIGPFTGLAMGSTNNAMIEGAMSGAGADNARSLLSKWLTLNLIRSTLPLAGGVFGLLSIQNEP